MLHNPPCPVCASPTALLDVVDFNKSCPELIGEFLPLSGYPIYYSICSACGFSFAPEFLHWSEADFRERIYNDQYVVVDNEYLEIRPTRNAKYLHSYLGQHKERIRHLDYGGGTGVLSQYLLDQGWDSQTYDPIVNKNIDPHSLGKFNLITAYEVFEHVNDVGRLIKDLSVFVEQGTVIYFSTMLSDGILQPPDRRQRLSWWYAAPRNGHISLFSKKSLELLGERVGLKLKSYEGGAHCYFNEVPDWAAHWFSDQA